MIKSGPSTVNIYLFEVKIRNTRKRWEICSRLSIKTLVGSQRHHSGIWHHWLLTLNMFYILLFCFHCRLWTVKWHLVYEKVFLNEFVRSLWSSVWTRREPCQNKFHTMLQCVKICYDRLFTGIHNIFGAFQNCFEKTLVKIFSLIKASQLAFACSKSIIETPEQYVKFVQSLQQTLQNIVNDFVLTSSLLTLNRFCTLFWYFHCWHSISKGRLEYLGPSHTSVTERFWLYS